MSEVQVAGNREQGTGEQPSRPSTVSMSSIVRREDWPERLHEFLHTSRSRSFEWGKTDCCMLVCDAVLAITDHDMAEDFRGSYSTMIGSISAMSSYLRNTWNVPVLEMPPASRMLEEFAAKMAAERGFMGIPPGLAQRGDVVLFDQEAPVAGAERGSGATLGLVDTHGTHAISIAPDGLVRIPVSECRRAWRIG